MASACVPFGSRVLSGSITTSSSDSLFTRAFLLGLALALKEKDIKVSITRKYKASNGVSLKCLPRDSLKGRELCGR